MLEMTTRINYEFNEELGAMTIDMEGCCPDLEASIATIIAIYATDNDMEPTEVVDRIAKGMKVLEKEGYTRDSLKADLERW